VATEKVTEKLTLDITNAISAPFHDAHNIKTTKILSAYQGKMRSQGNG